MQLDLPSIKPSNLMDSLASPDPAQDTIKIDTLVSEKAAPSKTTGVKPVAPPKVKPPPLVYLTDKSKWSVVSTECNKLHIHYTNARHLMDSIKITVPSIQGYSNLTRLLINDKISFLAHPLDEERKIKATARKRWQATQPVIRGLVLIKTDSAKEMCKNLSKVCDLSGITVELPYKKEEPGQCHRQTHKGGPARKLPPGNNIQNFPTLGNKTKGTPTEGEFRLAPAPNKNAWFRNQSLRAAPEPTKGSTLIYPQDHIQRIRKLAIFYMSRLSGMIGRKTKISLHNKRALYTICIRPVMTYACPVFAHATPTALQDLQVIQNKFCKRATGAQWYFKNSVRYRDLELPIFSKYMEDASERFFRIAGNHPNPLISAAALYEAPPANHFLRRPQNVLLNPLDDLTVEVGKIK
ncbi:RNA-directed DNA polymerase from mobile element jockey [Eumeta japonica]|uniref:RNA-directed DNA polymerase from mobile element jockey n=1 Tax=Eumeta variegata TaxID=151549 RepID=A0A4C1UK59_EUMVA|nr:RNA-directed DNA polymerase from mobile element jockey [Eumeta japonica]